ncbi:MAG: ATP synthase F0 subunit C [Rickettsiales bacterium]|jgi:F-type H+-transporting ATPase subunit c|nr:ATP synthase F0 subunit C [Rickettsiales bacterium]
MDAITSLTIISSVSIFSAAFCVCIGAYGVAIGEAKIAEEAMHSIAMQPDEVNNISKTCFISIAMIESCAIYCLVIALIAIFANPFWNAMLTQFGAK